MTKIYYSDIDEKIRLQAKYPNVDAEWLPIPEEKRELVGNGPLVCDNNEPLERCPLGEHHIAKLLTEDD